MLKSIHVCLLNKVFLSPDELEKMVSRLSRTSYRLGCYFDWV